MILLDHKISFNIFPQIELMQNPVWSLAIVTSIIITITTKFPVFGIYGIHENYLAPPLSLDPFGIQKCIFVGERSLFYFIYIFYFFKFFFIIYFYDRHTVRERGRDTGRGRSRLHAPGARRGIRSRVSRIAPWAKGRSQTAAPPRDPGESILNVSAKPAPLHLPSSWSFSKGRAEFLSTLEGTYQPSSLSGQ